MSKGKHKRRRGRLLGGKKSAQETVCLIKGRRNKGEK